MSNFDWNQYQAVPPTAPVSAPPQASNFDWNNYQAASPASQGGQLNPYQQAFVTKMSSAGALQPVIDAGNNIASGIANTAYNAANTPYHWITGKTIPNPTQLTGEQGSGLINNFAHTIGEYAPINPVADAAIGQRIVSPLLNLAANAGTSGLIHGAIYNPDTPITSGAETGVINAGSSLIPAAGVAATKFGANQLAKTAIPGLISKATDSIRSVLGNASDYAMGLKNNYLGADNTATGLMADRLATAKNLDTQANEQIAPIVNANNAADQQATQLTNFKNNFVLPNSAANSLDNEIENILQSKQEIPNDVPNKFDPTSFVNTLQGIKSNLQDNIGQETNTIYDNSLAHVNKWLDTPPTTWQQAVQRAQNINDAPRTYAVQNNNAQDDYLRGVVGQARTGLKQSVLDSAQNAPDSNIADLWSQANKAYGQKMNYLQTPSTAGNTLQFNKTLASGMQGAGAPDAAILNEFVPPSAQTGTSSLDHLATLYGARDPETGNIIPDYKTAQQAMLSYQLRGLDKKGAANQVVANLYQGGSDAQREALVGGTPAQPLLQTASQGITNYGMPNLNPKGWQTAGRYGVHYGVPGAIGMIAALHQGLPWYEAGLVGAATAAGSHLGGNAIRANATPSRVQGLMNYGSSPMPALRGTQYISPGLLGWLAPRQQGAQQ